MSELTELRRRLQTNPNEEGVAQAIAKLAFGDNPNEKQVKRAQSAVGGSIDAALRLVERALPNRVIHIVLARQVYPSAAISPAPPFPEDPPMYRGSAVSAGEALLLAMVEALIQESDDESATTDRGGVGDRPVRQRPEPTTAEAAEAES